LVGHVARRESRSQAFTPARAREAGPGHASGLWGPGDVRARPSPRAIPRRCPLGPGFGRIVRRLGGPPNALCGYLRPRDGDFQDSGPGRMVARQPDTVRVLFRRPFEAVNRLMGARAQRAGAGRPVVDSRRSRLASREKRAAKIWVATKGEGGGPGGGRAQAQRWPQVDRARQSTFSGGGGGGDLAWPHRFPMGEGADGVDAPCMRFVATRGRGGGLAGTGAPRPVEFAFLRVGRTLSRAGSCRAKDSPYS